MRISAIKQQTKNPERVSIFVDGKYQFSLSLGELIKYQLKKDQPLDGAEIKKFKKISEEGKLRARAFEWLMNRPRSVREFRDYLYKKKLAPEQIDALVTEMIDKGYLDEQKFANWLIELNSRRGKSDRAIRAELYKKGINRDISDAVLAENAKDEEQRLRLVIDKKAKLSRYRNDPDKLKRYLISQGFSWSMVKQVLGADHQNQL